MARERLTERRVATMRPPASGRFEIFDTLRTGLCLRVTNHGAKSWCVLYRFGGVLRRDTIGTYPKVGLAAAREMAAEIQAQVDRGIDPRGARTQEAAASRDTVAEVAERFILRYVSQRRSDEPARILRRQFLPHWGDRPMREITRRDVIERLDSIALHAPVGANRALATLSTFFAWAMDRDVIDADPTDRVRKPTIETSRDRVLNDAELRAFWIGCGRLGWPFGSLFKLLALTAARKSEVAGLLRTEINADRRLLEIPASRCKVGRPTAIPLSPAALAVLEAAPELTPQRLPNGKMAPPFIFTTNGRTAVSGFSHAKLVLDGYMLAEFRRDAPAPDLVTLQPWVIHDLRRTARTGLSRFGVPADIAERCLGHTVGGVRGIYDRHQFIEERRAALSLWAQKLNQIVNPPTAQVIEIGKVA